jgi:hypothetical protein
MNNKIKKKELKMKGKIRPVKVGTHGNSEGARKG